MEVILFLVSLLGLWAYVRYDQRQIRDTPAEPMDRKKLKHGYVPGLSVKWLGLAGASVLMAGSCLLHVIDPAVPPFTGRWSWIHSLLYEMFGKYGTAISFGLLSLAFAWAALNAFQATAQQRRSQNAA